MSKKDLMDKISRASGQPRKRNAEDAPVRSRGERVRKGVVRRRRGPRPTAEAAATPAAAEAAVEATAKSRPVSKPAAAEPTPAPVETPKVEAKADVEAPPAPVAEKKEAPTPVEAPVAAEKPAAKEAAPEPKAEPAAAPAPAPEAKPAPAPAPEPAKVEAKAEKVVEAVKAEKAPEPTPTPAPEERPRRGLGKAVVMPPPGYDPSNPEAFHRRQRESRSPSPGAARVVSPAPADFEPRSEGPSRGRRRVAPGGGGDSAGPSRPSRRPRGRGRGRQTVGRSRRRNRSSAPKLASPQPKAQKRKVRFDDSITVSNLAHAMSVKAAAVVGKLLEMGQMASMNDTLDFETAAFVASEFEYEVENTGFDESSYLQHVPDETEEEEGDPRPPVITIMGHVDHGKTTLLDSIRESRVAAGEAGGITQHIGAYQVSRNGQLMTFLDTPGHAAFSAMRARGASVTDIVILVVAADDGVQPQTVEAISHAQAAGVPIVVAVNKCDKPGVNPDVVKQRLGEYELIPEEWGGDTLFVNVSALKKTGIDDLLEAVLLQAEMLDLRAAPDRHAEGVVIEAKLERGRGPVATVLVQKGTLKRGDHVVLGSVYGKVRAMTDFRGKKVKQAGPSTPVELFGISDLPGVGDDIAVVASEKNARTLADHRLQEKRNAALNRTRRRTLDDIRGLATQEEAKVLCVVLKADVQGSLEALKAAVMNIEVENCEVRVLHAGVGNINESDVNLVISNEGLLFGFNVKVDPRARRAADDAGVKPELHKVIYSILDRVEAELKGLLEPVFEEQDQGSAEVRQVFHISRFGSIAGSYVLDGKVGRNNGARLIREGREIWKGDIATLKRFKDDVREVAAGYECGISLDGFNDIQEGDIIQTFAMVEVDRA